MQSRKISEFNKGQIHPDEAFEEIAGDTYENLMENMNSFDIKEEKKNIKCIGKFVGNGQPITSIRYGSTSSIGEYVISTSDDHNIDMWHVSFTTDGEASLIKKKVFGEHGSKVNQLIVPTDNKYFLSSSFDKTMKLWSINEESHSIATFEGNTDAVLCAAMSPDDRMIISGGADGSLRLYNTLGMLKYTYSDTPCSYIKAIQIFKYKGTLLMLFTGSNKKIFIFNVLNFSCAGVVSPQFHSTNEITTLSVNHTGEYLASGGKEGVLTVWNILQLDDKYDLVMVRQWDFKSNINEVQFLKLSNRVVCGCDSGLFVYDFDHHCILSSFVLEKSKTINNSIQSITVKLDETVVFAGCLNGEIQVFLI